MTQTPDTSSTKATPKQWAKLSGYNETYGDEFCAAALELRAWVEALEAKAAACPHIVTSDEGTSYCALAEQTAKPTPNSRQIRSSLVERVSCAIDGRINPDQWLHQDAARAAIREVAAWMREQHDGDLVAAAVLQQEAER